MSAAPRRRWSTLAPFWASAAPLLFLACGSDSGSSAHTSGGQAGGSLSASGGAASATGGSESTTGGVVSASGGAVSAPDGGAAGAPTDVFECGGTAARFATSVVAHVFGPGQSFGQDKFPDIVLGPPRGGGCCGGSLDVASLGDGGSVVLEFANNVIVDGAGADFIVFENAFVPSSAPPESVYAELGRVSVSQDGETWSTFPCSAASYPYGSCAGWRPAFANADKNELDATNPEVAGGDPFDLADLGLGWARYVRVEDLPELDGGIGTFDLDAVAIANAGCP